MERTPQPPPSGGHATTGNGQSSIVTLNVGGELFQTTRETLSKAGPTSILSNPPPFIDRDPGLFAILLSFLRTGHPPPPPLPVSILSESRFYSISSLLLSSLSPPSLFHPFSLLPSVSLRLSPRDPVTSISLSSAGDLLASHGGGGLTSFDPSLLTKTSQLTPLPAIDSLCLLSRSAAAVAAADFPGLHILPLRRGAPAPLRVLHWSPYPNSLSPVLALSTSSNLLFGSFETSRRNASAVLAFDLQTFDVVGELDRKELFGAELDSAIPATKLSWLPDLGLVMAAGSHAGPAGTTGNIRFMDPRTSGSGKLPVWEIPEKVDCFADVAASDSRKKLFKIGVSSGGVFMADIRKMGTWTEIGDQRGNVIVGGEERKGGRGCKVETYGEWAFITRGAEVEVWSEVEYVSSLQDGTVTTKAAMRRNWLGGAGGEIEDAEGGGGTEKTTRKKKIAHWAFGGSRMAVAREGELTVEVWDSVPTAQ